MHTKNKQQIVWFLSALLLTAGFLFLALTKMPAFTQMLYRLDTAKMILECGVVAVILLVGYLKLPNRKLRQFLTLGLVLIFAWLHQIFLPVLLAVLYILSLVTVGYAITRLFFQKEVPGQLIAAFLYGCFLEVLEVCLLSLAGNGGYAVIRIAWLITLILAIAVLFWKKADPRKAISEYIFTPDRKMTVVEALIAGGTAVFLLIQLGRANHGLDYDSLWYGLRPEYVLNTGGGIYENLKQIGCVFLYAKGMEILMLPLANLPSYGFLLCFNIVIGWGLLLVTGRIVRSFASDQLASLSMLLIAAIPGIMNMTMSAKTDCITLLFQLILLFFAVQFLQTRNFYNVWMLLSACLFTYTLKVSSLYFSTALLMVFLIYFLIHCWHGAKPEGSQLRWLAVLPLSAAVLVLVSYRTVVCCGMAIISVGASLSAKMGFSYDLLWQSEPVQAAAVGTSGAQQSMLQKIGDLAYHTFILPNTDSTVHVVIAWATPLFLVLVLCIFCLLIARIFQKQKQKLGAAKRFLLVCFLVLLFFTILSLGILGQIDGNYYMLTYALAVIAFLTLIREDSFQPERLAVCFSPLLVFCFLFTCSSNWAWTSGFTEIKLLNCGYYPHQALFHEELEAGCPEITAVLDDHPTAKALTFGDQSFVNRIPCVAESYVTAEHDGNARWFRNAENFESYLALAEREYVFIQSGGVDTGEKMAPILGQCFLDGILTDPLIENGYLLAAVDPDAGTDTAARQENYDRYLQEVLGVTSTLETCTETSGYYEDGWIEAESRFVLQSGADGIVTIKGTMAAGTYAPGQQIRVSINGEEALTYELTGGDIEFSVSCPKNQQITVTLSCNFSRPAAAPDFRTIALILDALTAS